MKKNSLLILSIVTVVFVSIAANSAWAGNVQRNRWEGVAIGVGAAVLGKVLWDQYRHPRPEPVVVYSEPQRRRPRHHYRPRPRRRLLANEKVHTTGGTVAVAPGQ